VKMHMKERKTRKNATAKNKNRARNTIQASLAPLNSRSSQSTSPPKSAKPHL
jgi:hypothetical protein